jgi:hypothetical protein
MVLIDLWRFNRVWRRPWVDSRLDDRPLLPKC